MKTTILFPGYGAQNIGMGQTFYENYPNIKKTFNDASSYLNIDFIANFIKLHTFLRLPE